MRTTLTVAALSLTLSVCAAGGVDPGTEPEGAQEAPPAESTEVSMQEIEALDAEPAEGMPELFCEVSCSEDARRTSRMRLVWQAPSSGARAAGDEIVELTVYKGGFERGNYLRLSTGPEARMVGPSDPSLSGVMAIRAYQLEVVDTATDEAQRTAPDGEREMLMENLEPGINYRFRLLIPTADGWAPTREVMCKAAVCAADFQDSRGRGNR